MPFQRIGPFFAKPFVLPYLNTFTAFPIFLLFLNTLKSDVSIEPSLMCKLFLDCIFSFRVHYTKIFLFYCRMKINLQDEVNFSVFCTVQKRGVPFKISLMNAFRFIEKVQRKSNFLVESCTLNEKNI